MNTKSHAAPSSAQQLSHVEDGAYRRNKIRCGGQRKDTESVLGPSLIIYPNWSIGSLGWSIQGAIDQCNANATWLISAL